MRLLTSRPGALGWLERWDVAMAQHFPRREHELELAFTVIERLTGEPARLVDLGCGPGTLAARAAARFPTAAILGIDLDPFLLELARAAVGSERIRFAEADLRSPGWGAAFGDQQADAVCAMATLHYLNPAELPALTRTLAQQLRPGGVFLACDTFRLDAATNPRLAALLPGLRPAAETTTEPTETWATWWESSGRGTRLRRPPPGPLTTIHRALHRSHSHHHPGRPRAPRSRLRRGRRTAPGRRRAPDRRHPLTLAFCD